MYSLTKATDLLLKSYELWTNNSKVDKISKYNTHKVRHTFWVLEVWRNLLIKIKENKEIPKELINKAEICFILHDTWRFYQNDWNIVLENKDYDHWDKSYEIVKDNDYSEDICLAIKYHNKFEISWLYKETDYVLMSNQEQQNTNFLLNILKDADKLQNMIYSIFDSDSYFIDDKTAWNIKKWDISKINLEDTKKHNLIYRSNVNTFWDYYLATFSFVFDLYFKESIELLKFFNYFEKALDKIKNSPWVSNQSFEIIKESIWSFKLS